MPSLELCQLEGDDIFDVLNGLKMSTKLDITPQDPSISSFNFHPNAKVCANSGQGNVLFKIMKAINHKLRKSKNPRIRKPKVITF